MNLESFWVVKLFAGCQLSPAVWYEILYLTLTPSVVLLKMKMMDIIHMNYLKTGKPQ